MFIFNIIVGNLDEFIWLINGVFYLNDLIFVLLEFIIFDDFVSVYILILIVMNECGVDIFFKLIMVYLFDVEVFIEMDILEGCQFLIINFVFFSNSLW